MPYPLDDPLTLHEAADRLYGLADELEGMTKVQ